MINKLIGSATAEAIEYIGESEISKPKDSADTAFRVGICGTEGALFTTTLIGAGLKRISPLVPLATAVGSLLINCFAFREDKPEEIANDNDAISFDGTPLGPINENNYEGYGDANV